jgi:hypothetical protein
MIGTGRNATLDQHILIFTDQIMPEMIVSEDGHMVGQLLRPRPVHSSPFTPICRTVQRRFELRLKNNLHGSAAKSRTSPIHEIFNYYFFGRSFRDKPSIRFIDPIMTAG